jgi:hypothetical protein
MFILEIGNSYGMTDAYYQFQGFYVEGGDGSMMVHDIDAATIISTPVEVAAIANRFNSEHKKTTKVWRVSEDIDGKKMFLPY